MMEEVKGWLMGVITLAVLCAGADSLMPEGGARKAGQLACTMAMLCVMLRPLDALAGGDMTEYIREYSARLGELELQLEEQKGHTQKSVIEEYCGAYISDKAAELGVVCRAEVVCEPTEEGIWLPAAVRIWGDFSDVEQSRMTELLERQLGVLAENQSYLIAGEAVR